MEELNLSLTDEEMEFEYRRKLHRKALKRKRFRHTGSSKQSSVYVPDWYAERMIEKAVAERTMEREG